MGLGVAAAFDVDADQIAVLFDRFGPADQIALHLLASLAFQEGALRLRLHPEILYRDADAERLQPPQQIEGARVKSPIRPR